MKQTGMVRKIDELGRIVIPKEMRKKQHMVEGENIQFYLDEQNQAIILKKYSVVNGISSAVSAMLSVFANATHNPVLFCDQDEIIFSSLELLQKQRISDSLKQMIMQKEDLIQRNIAITETFEAVSTLISLYHGDEIYGGLVIIHQSIAWKDMNQDIIEFIKKVILQEIEECV